MLVKHRLAAFLKEEIISGRLKPGDRIVEAKWAMEWKVAQASVREAINILSAEGFVEKSANRSARVTQLSGDDVSQIYQVRAALESLAARLVTARKPNLSEMTQVIADMRSAAECNNIRAFYDRDLRFHLLLAEKSGNRFLLEHIKRLIVPLFAFVVMRRGGEMDNPQRWSKSVEEHRRILQALQAGDPNAAEAHVADAIRKFAQDTYEVLMKQGILQEHPAGEIEDATKLFSSLSP